jgi:type I restriction enzyme, S subunit
VKVETVKFRWLAKEVDFRNSADLDYPLMSVSQTKGVVPRSELMGNEGRAESLDNYKVCNPGQIVVNRMSASSGALGLASQNGLVSPDYAVLSHSNLVDPKYLEYVMRSSWFIGEMVARLKGIGVGGESASVRTPRINISDLADVSVPLPSIAAQRKISEFLDQQCLLLDRITSHHEQVGRSVKELTKSEREKLIRGDAGNRKKVPGWLGEIDSNWRTIRLGQIAKIKSGVGFPDEYQGKSFGDFPFMKVGDLGSADPSGVLETSENYIDLADAVKLGARLAPTNTIVFPKVGAALLNNRRVILGAPSVFDNNVMGLLFKEGNNRFWYHVLRSVDMGQIMNPGPVPSIGASQVSDISLPFPPIDEQNRITIRLDEIDQMERSLLVKNEEAILKISEYRKSLITSVVLGKIDVTSGKSVA